MLSAKAILAALSALTLARALDVEVTDYECDQSLPITADFGITCGGRSKCTFGSSIATVEGTLYYSKVYKTGLENNIGYLSTDVELLTLKYNLHEFMPVPLCSDYLVADSNNQNQCPYDGSYGFSVNYKLPSAGEQSTSWLASGWAGSGIMRIYAEEDESMLIGECTFSMKTYVTPSQTRGFMQAPSAAATVGIVLGALAAVALVCLYCYCCISKRKVAQESSGDDKTVTKDDLSTFFKRLDDEKSQILSAAASVRDAASVSLRDAVSVKMIEPSKPHSLTTRSVVSEMAI